MRRVRLFTSVLLSTLLPALAARAENTPPAPVAPVADVELPDFSPQAASSTETTPGKPDEPAADDNREIDIDNIVTSAPIAAANFTAMWPSPPSPTTPTRSPFLQFH